MRTERIPVFSVSVSKDLYWRFNGNSLHIFSHQWISTPPPLHHFQISPPVWSDFQNPGCYVRGNWCFINFWSTKRAKIDGKGWGLPEDYFFRCLLRSMLLRGRDPYRWPHCKSAQTNNITLYRYRFLGPSDPGSENGAWKWESCLVELLGVDFGESIARMDGSSAPQSRQTCLTLQNGYTVAINASATPESMVVAVPALGQV